MGGDGSPDSVGSKEPDATELDNPEKSTHTSINNKPSNNQNTEHQSEAGQRTAVSPVTWLSEIPINKTSQNTKPTKQLIEEIKSEPKKNTKRENPPLEIAGILPVLEAVTLVEQQRRPLSLDLDFYRVPANLDIEIAHKIPNAPNEVKDYYKEMRQAHMQHREPNLTSQQRGELAGWTLFGEKKEVDALDEIGRQTTQEYVQRKVDRGGRDTDDNEKKVDHRLLSQIHSLLSNDHDHLHNPDEITRPNGMYHLPETYTSIGLNNGQPVEKVFKVRDLDEEHMFVSLQGIPKVLPADECALLAFHKQITRQVLPLDLVDDAHEQDRDNILAQFEDAFTRGNEPLAAASKDDWQMALEQAKKDYPDMPKSMRARDLSDAEDIVRLLTVAEIQRIRTEEIARARALQRQGVPAQSIPKRAEAPFPDFIRKKGYNEVPMPMIEYREGQVSAERELALTIFGSLMKPYIQRDQKELSHLAAYKASGRPSSPAAGVAYDWRMPYLLSTRDTNATEIKTLKDGLVRYPLADQCDTLSKVIDFYSKFQANNLTEQQSKELRELDGMYKLPVNQRPCKHFVERQTNR